MKTLIKLYSAACLIFMGFLVFFSVPFESIPLSGPVTVMITGGTLLIGCGLYLWAVQRREAFHFGWFLAMRGGFWVITAACFGLVILLSGLLLYLAPQAVEPAFERGAMPVAAGLVVLFWLALIFMFGFLSFMSFARIGALMRSRLIKKLPGAVGIGAVCVFLAGVFFSLFVEVINDIFVRIPVNVQWAAIWTFVGLVGSGGVVYGATGKKGTFLETDELEGGPEKGN